VSSREVRFWDVSRRAGRSNPYRVRWSVTGRQHERSFPTKALADHFRIGLIQAARRAEAFDEGTGLPESRESRMPPRPERTWYEHARGYAEMKWPSAAAKSRRSAADALATVTPALVSSTRAVPPADVLRRALYAWAFNPSTRGKDTPPDIAAALQWVERSSIKVSEMASPAVIRQALDACSRTTDGTPAAATTVRRKRAVLHNALGYAVELELLDSNPVGRVQWRAPQVAATVDRRIVANPDQVESLLAAVGSLGERGERLRAFFGTLYYAALRPAEAIALRGGSCVLPAEGWGRLVVSESTPRAGSEWTDDGAPREHRGLKHRGQNDTRSVPIPPELVRLLREHVARYGLAPDGRLFRSGIGGSVQDSTYAAVWRRARQAGLTEELAASPLARRPYDLRHAAISLWLNAGVPATEVARRAGHGVAVMLAVYANCVDGEEQAVNRRIEQALVRDGSRGTLGSSQGPVSGSDGESVGASWADSLGEEASGCKTAGQEGSHSGLVRRS
jgi:integrase